MSEELKAALARIACLEGEIAKRDARIVGLELEVALRDQALDRHVEYGKELRAELAAIKAQEPVAWAGVIEDCASLFVTEPQLWKAIPLYAAPVSEAKAQDVVQWPEADEIMQMAFEEGQPADDASGYCFELEEFDLFIERLMSEVARLNAAPVSEAKAQGVVMPERWNVPRPMWKDARQPYGNPLNHADIEAAEKFNLALDEVARLNAAPVQQVSVPDVSAMARILADRNADACNVNREDNWAIYGQDYIDDVTAMLAVAPAAPAAPAADAGDGADVIRVDRQMAEEVLRDLPRTNLIARYLRKLLAAHRAKGAV